MQQWEDDEGGQLEPTVRGKPKWMRGGRTRKKSVERKRAGWRKITREANVLALEGGERERECAKSTNLPLFHLVLHLSVYLSISLLLSLSILSCLCPSHPPSPPFSPVYAERRDCRYYGGVRIVTLINQREVSQTREMISNPTDARFLILRRTTARFFLHGRYLLLEFSSVYCTKHRVR